MRSADRVGCEYVARVAARRGYAARRSAWDFLYRRAEPGEACVYCDGQADSLDHVPPLAAVEAEARSGSIRLRHQLVPCCMACNRALVSCLSDSISERRAFAFGVRSGRRARFGRTAAVAGYRLLVSRDGFKVRLTGWRNAYVAWVRDASGEWYQAASASDRSALLVELAVLPDVSERWLSACEVLPASARDVPAGEGLLAPTGGLRRFGLAVPGELLQVRIPPMARSFRVYARSDPSDSWERLFGVSDRARLVARVRAAGLPSEFCEACEGLPELPADWRSEAAP